MILVFGVLILLNPLDDNAIRTVSAVGVSCQADEDCQDEWCQFDESGLFAHHYVCKNGKCVEEVEDCLAGPGGQRYEYYCQHDTILCMPTCESEVMYGRTQVGCEAPGWPYNCIDCTEYGFTACGPAPVQWPWRGYSCV